MAIMLSYACSECTLRTRTLDDAQRHADDTGHVVHVSGSLTSRAPVIDKQAIEAAAEKKLREAQIMRTAKERGLVGR